LPKPMIAVLLAAVLLTASVSSQAQGVYKYTDKNGRVVYTDDPKAGGGHAQPVEDAGMSIPSPSTSTPEARRLLEQAGRRDAELDRATGDIASAHAALREAEERKQAGIEPIEGERQGRRFRPEYWQRQQALQRDVDVSRAQLEDALARRNALR
jgi:hypothetical protein